MFCREFAFNIRLEYFHLGYLVLLFLYPFRALNFLRAGFSDPPAGLTAVSGTTGVCAFADSTPRLQDAAERSWRRVAGSRQGMSAHISIRIIAMNLILLVWEGFE